MKLNLALLLIGFVAGIVLARLYWSKAIGEYYAIKAWAEGELALLPSWLAGKIKKI